MAIPHAADRPDPQMGPIRFDVNPSRTIYCAFDARPDHGDSIVMVVTRGHNAPLPTQEELDQHLSDMERRAGTQ